MEWGHKRLGYMTWGQMAANQVIPLSSLVFGEEIDVTLSSIGVMRYHNAKWHAFRSYIWRGYSHVIGHQATWSHDLTSRQILVSRDTLMSRDVNFFYIFSGEKQKRTDRRKKKKLELGGSIRKYFMLRIRLRSPCWFKILLHFNENYRSDFGNNPFFQSLMCIR